MRLVDAAVRVAKSRAVLRRGFPDDSPDSGDYARSHGTAKRGGGAVKLQLDDAFGARG